MPDHPQLWTQARRLWTQGAWIYIPIGTFLLALGIWAVIVENDMSFYWLDPAVVVNTSPWIGLFSNIGNFLWWIPGLICVFSAILLWRVPGHRQYAIFFLCWGLLTGFLALDDFFMIHEWVIPTYLPLSEDFMFAVYFAIAGTLIFRFRDVIRQSPYPIFFFALACFGASIVIDVIGPVRLVNWGLPIRLVWNLEYIVEDGLKLAGIIAWGHYFTLFALLTLRPLLPTAPAAEPESADQPGE